MLVGANVVHDRHLGIGVAKQLGSKVHTRLVVEHPRDRPSEHVRVHSGDACIAEDLAELAAYVRRRQRSTFTTLEDQGPR